MGSNGRTSNTLSFPHRSVRGKLQECWVDEQAVSRHFGVSTRTVRRWRAAGMPSLLVGGARRYRIGEVERWHREQNVGS